jgi:hypothetical protein
MIIPAPDSPKVLPITEDGEEEEEEDDEEDEEDDDLSTFSGSEEEDNGDDPKPTTSTTPASPPRKPVSPIPSTSTADPDPPQPRKRPSKLSIPKPPAKKARTTQSIQRPEGTEDVSYRSVTNFNHCSRAIVSFSRSTYWNFSFSNWRYRRP